MALDRQIFKILAAKTQARVVSNIEDANYIRRFFNTVQGVGCRVDAPRQDGKGWRIIVDGTSDIDTSGTGEPSIWTTLTRNTFPARITGTGASDGIYTFQELVPTGGLADTWADRLSEEDTPALFRTGDAVEISGNAAIKIATARANQKRVIMQESVEGYWWFFAPMCVALNQGTAFYAKFSSETAWTEHDPTGATVPPPARTGTIGSGGSNTTEVNGNTKAEQYLVVLMTATGEDEYVYASPVPYLETCEVVTALENGKPEATYPRVTSS